MGVRTFLLACNLINETIRTYQYYCLTGQLYSAQVVFLTVKSALTAHTSFSSFVKEFL